MKTQPKRVAFNRRRLLAERLEDRRLLAGPYAPAVGEIGSTAISKDDLAIVAWASAVASYTPGSDVDAEFQIKGKAIGPAEGSGDSSVSLGRGGQITLTFDQPIRDGIGPDFAVFENSFSDTFLELGFVEVSSDGTNFFRFPNDSLTPSPVNAFGAVDPTEVHNLAGKYRHGFGTPFDLGELVGANPLLDTTSVTHVRLIDIVGDGLQTDSSGDPIYDPFPTTGSAGLDVDAVGVLHQSEFARDVIGFEDRGATLAAESAFSGPDPGGSTIVGPFGGNVVVGSLQSETLSFNNAYSSEFESWNQWSYANATDTTTPGFTNQFSSFAGGGAGGSSTFGIGFADQSTFFDPPTISRQTVDSRRFESLMVTNTTYAALSMRDGDSFAKKFGGVSGDDPDFLRLTITGKSQNGQSIGNVDFYLADYRFTDNSLDYIVDQWVEVDLSSIAEARSLEFSITSSDVGPFGTNTPAYFAVDNITLSKPVLAIDIADRQVTESDGVDATFVRISRPDNDTTKAIDITIAPVDSSRAIVPASVTIPAGERFVEFSVGVVNNNVVEGDRQISIVASAVGFVAASRTLTIHDDDVRALTLTLGQSDLNEGSSLVATVRRNDADLSTSLLVQLSATDSSLVLLRKSVNINAGQAAATFTITAIDDNIDRPPTGISILAMANGYAAASVSLQVADNDQPTVSIEVNPSGYSESDAAPSARLEDVGRRLPPESFYNGADGAGGFASEGLAFNNDYDPTFGSWAGWSFSNSTDTTTPGFTSQYSAFTGVGADGSESYAVAAALQGAPVPTITRDPAASGEFRSLTITNTTYAALSMMQGDSFAKKFGGESGDDPDFFLLTIEGVDTSGSSVGTIDFYLADFRFSDNSLDYIVDQWTIVDLSAIAGAVQLKFSLSSSDVGSFGMNTPAYFAVDNVMLAGQTASPMLTLRRNVSDVSNSLQVALTSSDSTEVVLPAIATIPAGASSVSVPLGIVDDAVVDGDQTVTLGVAAGSHVPSSVSVTIRDDDVATLFLSIPTPLLDEFSGKGRAVVHRNVADTGLPQSVLLSVTLVDQLALPSEITIPAGRRSAEFAFTVEDNFVVDGERTVSVLAMAEGFTSISADVSILDDDVAMPTLALELDVAMLSEADAPSTAMLEDVGAALPAESFNNGADMADGFVSGQLGFNNTFDPAFGSWGGWSVSNTTDVTTAGFLNQYSAFAGGGANDSATYAVASAFPGGIVPTISRQDPSDGLAFASLMVTNTTYAALSIAEGDGFAKKFGGPSGDDPDFFLLTIEGRDKNGESVGTVEFYLADFRFEDNSQDYLIDQWTSVDVSSLMGAAELAFSLRSSDVGEFGMNTPAYFAVDQIVLTDVDATAAIGTVTRSDTDLSQPLVVNLGSDDSTEAVVPASVVIPSGSASTTFVIHSVDDAVVDGAKTVSIAASAAAHTSSSASLTIQDDDVPTLAVAFSRLTVGERAGLSSAEVIVHRNLEDLTPPLMVQLTTTGGDIALPAAVTIPAGMVSVAIPLDAVDNSIRDGDRAVVIEASANGFASAAASLAVTDDERSGLLVDQPGGVTEVGEWLGQDELRISLLSQPLSDVFVDVTYGSGDVILDVTRLHFMPDEWNQAQIITVEGIPDLEIEDDETVTVTLSIDPEVSDSLFALAQQVTLEVLVHDHQPTALRLGEDDTTVFLVDEVAGVRIASHSHRDGIEVVASDLPQDLVMDPLTRSRGLVQVNLSGGDDHVTVRSLRFTSLSGGDGYDQLILNLDVPVELASFLDSRVIEFEEFVLASDLHAELAIDGRRLQSIVSDGEAVVIRTDANQKLKFIGDQTLEQPIMIGGEFAQVISLAGIQVHLISQSPWQNVVSKWDVNHSGDVTSLDALAVVNQLARVSESELPPLTSIEQFAGQFFDVSGDGRITSLDALRVINELARRQLVGEGEVIALAGVPDVAAGESKEPAAEVVAIPLDKPVQKIVARTAAAMHDEVLRELYATGAEQPVEEDAVPLFPPPCGEMSV